MSEKRIETNDCRDPLGLPIMLMGLLIKTAEEGVKLQEQAIHDSLTGAFNRRGLETYLETANAPKALLLVDATNFKAVNDGYGHDVGDQLIKDTFSLLQTSVRPSDQIARWGGDEFVIVLNGEDDEQKVTTPLIEEKRYNANHTEHIESAKARIAHTVELFISKRPYLSDVNFDLAVGGIKWVKDFEIDNLIHQAEQDMKRHKDEQHISGQYRN